MNSRIDNIRTAKRFAPARQWLLFAWMLSVALPLSLHAQPVWEVGLPLNTARSGASSAVVNGEIYVLGGLTQQMTVSHSVERFNNISNMWDTTAPSFSTGRYNAAAIVHNGELYLIGGLDSAGQSLNSVEIYSPSGNTWRNGDTLNIAREGHVVVPINGSICVIGGRIDNGNFVAEIEYLDTQSGGWLVAPNNITAPRASPFAFGAANEFYMFGGLNPTPTIASYRATVNQDFNFNWNNAPVIAEGRGYGASALLNGQLFLMGGETLSDTSNRVEIYDFGSDTLSDGDSLLTPRLGMTAVNYQQSIYLIGGFIAGDSLPTNLVEVYEPQVVSIDDLRHQPIIKTIGLKGFPNPFNGRIQLSVTLPESDSYNISIYDIQGRLVTKLHDGRLPGGTHRFQWDGRNAHRQQVSSGTYLVVVRAKSTVNSLKILYLR